MYWRMDNLSVTTSPHCHAKMISPSPVTSIAHSERGLASWLSFLFIVEFWLNWFCAGLMSSWVSGWHVMSSRQCFVQFILSFWLLNSFCPFFHDVLWILEERVILMSHLGLVTCIRSFSVLLPVMSLCINCSSQKQTSLTKDESSRDLSQLFCRPSLLEFFFYLLKTDGLFLCDLNHRYFTIQLYWIYKSKII